MLTWTLCIATLNRKDILAKAVQFALDQTRPPSQIVIIDASEDWEDSKSNVEALLSKHKDIELEYLEAPVRSSATQRNFGIEKCTSDILFLIDDDTFMFPDCAESVMGVYEADTKEKVAGVSALAVPELPSPDIKAIDQKSTGRSASGSLREKFLSTSLGKFVNKKILLQSTEELFITYDGPRTSSVPTELEHLGLEPISFLGGCTMTARRKVAEKELFDTSLRYYAAFEDLDASYRYAKHGQLVLNRAARIHHYEAATGRIKRQKVIIFQLMNLVVFIKRNATDPKALVARYRLMLGRRLIGETIKDLLSARFTFPQARAVVFAIRNWRSVWRRDADELDIWYPEFQKAVLDEINIKNAG